MTQLSQAFGQTFDKDKLRIRSFELGGHTFKVKVPLTSEFEAMTDRMKAADNALIEKYYNELTQEFKKNQSDIPEDLGIKFLDNDIVIQGRSMKEAAKNKALTELRIVEMFKLLIPNEQGFDMNTITYDMIEEMFPFPIQMDIIEAISETVSPSYKATRGK